MTKHKGLGRGLDALLDRDRPAEPPRESLGRLSIDQLRPGKYQPRTRMDEASLNELADSIKVQGLIQPILVRAVNTGSADGADKFEIIAGERRWRAARIAGLADVPVVIREVPDQSALAMSLIENIQRESLNPLEEAGGIQRLIDEFGLTHQQAAEAVGRSRAATSNLLRLLNLDAKVQALVFEGKLDMGHARALLAVQGARQVELAGRVAEQGLSVRETEQLVGDTLNPPAKTVQSSNSPRPKPRMSRDIQRLEEDLSEKLGTTIEIKDSKKGSGKLVLHYMSLDHLDELLALLRA